MKASVIITTTGRESLSRAVGSVREQSYDDYELIIIDDSKREGGAKALNKGIDQAQGEYIAILDDDDYWVSQDKLEKQVKFLDDNPEYIAVGTQTEGCEVPSEVSLTGTPFAHSSLMFRKGLRYNEELERAKDLDMILNLNKKGLIGTLKDCYIYYEINNDLSQKIKDCHWHRRVVLTHKGNNWLPVYLGLFVRQIKLMKIKCLIYLGILKKT